MNDLCRVSAACPFDAEVCWSTDPSFPERNAFICEYDISPSRGRRDGHWALCGSLGLGSNCRDHCALRGGCSQLLRGNRLVTRDEGAACLPGSQGIL